MIDVVIPNDNEKEFVKMAEELGIKGIIFCYKTKKFPDISLIKTKIKIKQANLQEPKNLRKTENTIIVKAIENSRQVVEFGASILYDNEIAQEKDTLHQRVSGLNQIICKIAKQKEVTIGFSVLTILKSSGKERSEILGRMAQNIRLCRKYEVKMKIASFATDPIEMRSPHDLESLFTTIGMNQGEAKEAINSNIK